MVPHSTDPRYIKREEEEHGVTFDHMDQLIDKAAHLTREQEIFLVELNNFKIRLEQVERQLILFKRNK